MSSSFFIYTVFDALAWMGISFRAGETKEQTVRVIDVSLPFAYSDSFMFLSSEMVHAYS